MRHRLPNPDIKYDLYNAKMCQVIILNSRGYQIPEDELWYLNKQMGNKAKYNNFLMLYPDYDQSEHNNVYPHPNKLNLEVFYCTSGNASRIIENAMMED